MVTEKHVVANLRKAATSYCAANVQLLWGPGHIRSLLNTEFLPIPQGFAHEKYVSTGQHDNKRGSVLLQAWNQR